MHNFPSFIQYMIPLYLFCGKNAFPIHQLNRTFTILLDAAQYCSSSSERKDIVAGRNSGEERLHRRTAMHDDPLLRRGSVRRRRPVIKGLTSEEASACRRRPSKCGPVLRRNAPPRRTTLVMRPEKQKSTPERVLFGCIFCVR